MAISQREAKFYDTVEQAKKDLDEVSAPSTTPGSPELASDSSRASIASIETPSSSLSPSSIADSFVFAFDIDGVLVRGGKAIPEAIQAMKVLNGENEYGIHVPHIFLTNGGGKTEEERCRDLSRQLLQDIKPGQFICGHTPMREMAETYGTVLVVGGEGEKCREVAEGYGFKDVVTPGDIIKHDAATTPFRKLTPEEHSNSRVRDFDDVTIDAVFVCLPIPVTGLVTSRSCWILPCPRAAVWHHAARPLTKVPPSTSPITTLSGLPRTSTCVWAWEHYVACLKLPSFNDLTKGQGKLNTHAFGKPQVPTFEFASRLMKQWRHSEHGICEAPKTVYFVGDTPESDIRGTNAVNQKAENDWYSILVKTGVYQEGTEPAYKPRVTVDNVLDAVNHGIEREMRKKLSTSLKHSLERVAAEAAVVDTEAEGITA